MGHDEVDVEIGQTLKLTVSRAAYMLFLSNADYETYMRLEPMQQTLCFVAKPPTFEVLCYGAAHWHILVWPMSDREPEWNEDFSYSIEIGPREP